MRTFNLENICMRRERGAGCGLRLCQFKISCDYLDQFWNLCFCVCHLLILPTNIFCFVVQLDFWLLKNKDDSVPIIIILWQTKSTNCLLWFIIWNFNPLSEGSMFVFEIITSSLEPPVTVMGWKTWFVKLLFYFTEWCYCSSVTRHNKYWQPGHAVTRCHAATHHTSHNCGHRDGQQCKCCVHKSIQMIGH